jgi:hypothetical protein
MRTALTALGVALLLGLAAGCGGGGDSQADTEFRAQVEAVCADYGPKLAHLAPPVESDEEWAAIGADMGDLLEASVNELREIEPPDSLSDDYAAWLELRAELLTAMRDVQSNASVERAAELDAALARVNEAVAQADPLAEELGLDACSPTGVRTER